MKRRNIYWLPNAILFYAQRNKKRDPDLWLFGAWRGKKYDDNSRYLFEYVNMYCPQIKAIWLSDIDKTVSEVREAGFSAEYSSSKRGRELQQKAGKVFYTNGIDDFGNVTFVYGAQIIALWHGTGFKKLYYKGINYKGVKYKIKRIKDKLFDFVYRDVSIATSRIAARWICDCFLVDEKTVYITGLPRNDAFRKDIIKGQVLPNIVSCDDYRYILYLPTYRPYNNDSIINTICELSSDTSFVNELRNKKCKIILKLHPLTTLDAIEVPDVFIIVDDKEVSSIQELMKISDALITDYSSAILDYAILNRPTLLFAPDYEEYCKQSGISDEIITLYKGFAEKSIGELKDHIMFYLNSKNHECELTKRINEMYQDPSITESCFSENVVRLLEKIDCRSYICEK